jgi:hypothetical protein
MSPRTADVVEASIKVIIELIIGCLALVGAFICIGSMLLYFFGVPIAAVLK